MGFVFDRQNPTMEELDKIVCDFVQSLEPCIPQPL